MTPLDLDELLLKVVLSNSTLCLNVGDPGWGDARGYVADPASLTMYFPVSKEFLDGRNLDEYSVLLWSEPRVVVTGSLAPAASPEDADVRFRLLIEQGWEHDKADQVVYDRRGHRPRRNSYKLRIRSLRRPTLSDVRTKDPLRVLGSDKGTQGADVA